MTESEPLVYESKLRQGGEFMLREASAYFAGGGRLRLALPLDFAGQLDPSVRAAYRQLWQQSQGAPLE